MGGDQVLSVPIDDKEKKSIELQLAYHKRNPAESAGLVSDIEIDIWGDRYYEDACFD